MEHGYTLLFLILIFAAAKLGGEVAERLRQPAVLGELLVGVLLGLTPLRLAVEDPAIAFIATIGIIVLLFETGLENELADFLKVGKSAASVAVMGILLPLAGGYGLMMLINGDYRQALFIGATLTATSIGITTRVLADMGKSKTRESSIILGAAVIDDILGLLILAVTLQIAHPGTLNVFSIVKAIALALVFLAAAMWIGLRYAPRLIALTQHLKTRGVLVGMAFLFCLTLAYLAKEIGLAEIVGAFAAGLILASTEDRVQIQTEIKPVANIFVPVFFVLVGLQVDLRAINVFSAANLGLTLTGLGLLVIAILGKMAAGSAVTDKRLNKLAIGTGMLPRGEVGIIFASIGQSQGIISAGLYGILILVVFITTLISPILMKYAYRRGAIVQNTVDE